MDSNHDKEYQKPNDPQRNANAAKTLQLTLPFGRTTGRTSMENEEGTPDAELTEIMRAWPTLPEPIKAAVRALLGTVK